MKKFFLNSIVFLFGIFIGGVGAYWLFSQKEDKYVSLDRDCVIEGHGYLKKGALIKVDEAMSEGFTRYILYLNLKGDFTSNYNPGKKHVIIPYWLNVVENDTSSRK